jgi:hypothetical protein
MREKICEKCKFFQQAWSGPFGSCHRYAPKLIKPDYDGFPFPTVRPHDWCGEFDSGQSTNDLIDEILEIPKDQQSDHLQEMFEDTLEKLKKEEQERQMIPAPALFLKRKEE